MTNRYWRTNARNGGMIPMNAVATTPFTLNSTASRLLSSEINKANNRRAHDFEMIGNTQIGHELSTQNDARQPITLIEPGPRPTLFCSWVGQLKSAPPPGISLSVVSTSKGIAPRSNPTFNELSRLHSASWALYSFYGGQGLRSPISHPTAAALHNPH